jgi:hypothetical protein
MSTPTCRPTSRSMSWSIMPAATRPS